MTKEPEVRDRVPEPALVRGALIAVLSLVGVVLGRELDTAWVEDVIAIYTVIAPIVLAWWIRRHVTPVIKGSE